MGQRLLVLRGDINSSSGYSQAIALYLQRLERHFDVVLGVDLHPNPTRLLERWPYPVIEDREVQSALDSTSGNHLVLSVTTPPNFKRFERARNVGLFFWETLALHQPLWQQAIATMDEVWLPAQFVVDMLRREGTRIPLVHVPVPLRDLHADEAISPTGADRILLHEVTPGHAVAPLTSLRAVRERYPFVALSVNALLARKGFPVLASEWFSFVGDHEDRALVLKVNSIDITESASALLDRIARLFSGVLIKSPARHPHVFVTTENLSVAGMRTLSSSTDLYVTASYGEGLGLGVFEALLAGKPAVCPRHTSFAELLPDDYRYWVDCEIGNYGLYDPVGLLPPSARSGVAREGALAAALERCEADLASGDFRREVDRAVHRALEHSRFDFEALVASDRKNV